MAQKSAQGIWSIWESRYDEDDAGWKNLFRLRGVHRRSQAAAASSVCVSFCRFSWLLVFIVARCSWLRVLFVVARKPLSAVLFRLCRFVVARKQPPPLPSAQARQPPPFRSHLFHLLYKDYQSDHEFTVTTYTAGGVAISSTGVKKGDIFLVDVSTQLKNNNITTDVKVGTHSNVHTIVTIDELAPGLKTIFSFRVPNQRFASLLTIGGDRDDFSIPHSCPQKYSSPSVKIDLQVELQYQHEYAGRSTGIGLTASPIVNFADVLPQSIGAMKPYLRQFIDV
uniref:Uncharacterized protein n=1 Tax=Cucumis melo TaxID=3656 RepID=A0A9I9EB86_CUCME